MDSENWIMKIEEVRRGGLRVEDPGRLGIAFEA